MDDGTWTEYEGDGDDGDASAATSDDGQTSADRFSNSPSSRTHRTARAGSSVPIQLEADAEGVCGLRYNVLGLLAVCACLVIMSMAHPRTPPAN